jgi:hypothetical protein
MCLLQKQLSALVLSFQQFFSFYQLLKNLLIFPLFLSPILATRNYERIFWEHFEAGLRYGCFLRDRLPFPLGYKKSRIVFLLEGTRISKGNSQP